MTELPAINPLTAHLMGGDEALEGLRKRLLAMADGADDPAYAARLRDVAAGRRPLRTVMLDPSWRHAVGLDTAAAQELIDSVEPGADGSSPRDDVRSQIDAARRRLAGEGGLSQEELAAAYQDTLRLQRQAKEILEAEERTGWGGSLDRLAAAGETARTTEGPATPAPRRERPDWDRWGRR